MPMSAEHKAALAAGRKESRAIKAYLDSLGTRRRGRPVTQETLTKRVKDLEKRIGSETNVLRAVDLRQARLEAEEAMTAVAATVDREKLESDFARHVRAYSKRKGISYSVWREAGVPAAVLKRAGIGRGN